VSEYASNWAFPLSIALFSIKLSVTKFATTTLADTPSGRGLEVETLYGGRLSWESVAETPGAMIVGATDGLAEADGTAAGALAQAAVQTTTKPAPTMSAIRRDRPHPDNCHPLVAKEGRTIAAGPQPDKAEKELPR
jgi:hypothetical protein